MKGIVDAKDFCKALDMVSQILQKSKLPILETVHIRFSGERCTLTGTDLTTWLTVEIPAHGDDFAFALPRVRDMVRVCRRFRDEVEIRTTELISGNVRTIRGQMCCDFRGGEFNALASEEYPLMPQPQMEHSFTANGAKLLERVARIKYAAEKPTQYSRPRYNCIQFGGNRIFCLDGCQAAWDIDDNLTVPEQLLIPVSVLEHLKFFGNQDVTIQFNAQNVRITDGAVTLQTRKPAEEIFDLDCAIPQHPHETFHVHTKTFLNELNYLKEFMPKATKPPVVYFKNGALFTVVNGCKCRTMVYVEGRSEIPFAFNLNYMRNTLRQFQDAEYVKMEVTSSLAPIILTAAGRSNSVLLLPHCPKYTDRLN